MSRICARPGCRQVAAATLSYSYADRSVWIEHLTPVADPMQHDMCEEHVDGLVLPNGWSCRDLRPVAPVGGPIPSSTGTSAPMGTSAPSTGPASSAVPSGDRAISA